MFGKPQWFRAKAIGWGLRPTTWQGWFYTGTWVGAIAGPFLLLLARQQPMEASVWMALGLAALAYDVRMILLAMNPAKAPVAHTAAAKRDDNVLYIMDDSQTHPRVATRGFNLQPR